MPNTNTSPARLKPSRRTLRKPLRTPLRTPLRKLTARNQMHTLGSAKSIVIRNGAPIVKAVHWDVDYDGTKATGQVDVQNQDSVYKYKVNLNNIDLGQLLSTHSVPIPIDQRLRESFDSRVVATDDSVNHTPRVTSSFNDYVHPSFVTTRNGVRTARRERKKYRVTPHLHNSNKTLRKRKGLQPRLTHINQ